MLILESTAYWFTPTPQSVLIPMFNLPNSCGCFRVSSVPSRSLASYTWIHDLRISNILSVGRCCLPGLILFSTNILPALFFRALFNLLPNSFRVVSICFVSVNTTNMGRLKSPESGLRDFGLLPSLPLQIIKQKEKRMIRCSPTHKLATRGLTLVLRMPQGYQTMSGPGPYHAGNNNVEPVNEVARICICRTR